MAAESPVGSAERPVSMGGVPPIVDRSEMFRRLGAELTVDPARTALITIDCHRGHLDPRIATQPAPADRAAAVAAGVGALARQARSLGMPVAHVILNNRVVAGRAEPMHNPFWRAVEAVNESLTPEGTSTISGHNRVGSAQTELMPELGPEPGDFLFETKRRLSVFLGTDLDLTLRELGIRTVVLVGINTNTCVLCAAFEACNRDLAVVVVSDCVASMYGEDLHWFGLQNIARCLGWVTTSAELLAKLGVGEASRAGGRPTAAPV